MLLVTKTKQKFALFRILILIRQDHQHSLKNYPTLRLSVLCENCARARLFSASCVLFASAVPTTRSEYLHIPIGSCSVYFPNFCKIFFSPRSVFSLPSMPTPRRRSWCFFTKSKRTAGCLPLENAFPENALLSWQSSSIFQKDVYNCQLVLSDSYKWQHVKTVYLLAWALLNTRNRVLRVLLVIFVVKKLVWFLAEYMRFFSTLGSANLETVIARSSVFCGQETSKMTTRPFTAEKRIGNKRGQCLKAHYFKFPNTL
jgi:hypothetical protein